MLTLFGDGLAQTAGLCAWLLMALAFQPMLRFYQRLAPLGRRPAGHRGGLYAVHRAVGPGSLARPRRDVEGARPGHGGRHMTGAADFASGKGHRDENFPVASRLVRPELRPAILAFYRFARAADDVADHAQAAAEEKLEQLARMEAGLRGQAGANPEGRGAACGPAGPRPRGSTCARPAGSLPTRCHQAALRRLGGAHGLLPLFRGPGRSLRARRAWREHRRSGRPTTRSAPRCR